ncbi:hypothetical protein CIG19_01040 [Enterobacterales bacterium CwR94]|nr:hypothetical protein CIG19_01040 [Enterobacterales bacterium CwR94]
MTDHDGSWKIGSQGGYLAEGDWPDFNDKTQYPLTPLML